MAIDEIPYRFPISNRTSIIDSEELTALELAGRTTEKVNEVIDLVNTQQADIDTREKSDDITNNRKLSPTGNFTGSWFGYSNPIMSDPGIMNVLNDLKANVDQRVINVRSVPYLADNTAATDATAAIQQAIDDANALGGSSIVFIPKGTYSISAPLKIYSGITIMGAGRYQTYLTNSAEISFIKADPTATGCVIEGLSFKMNFANDKAIDMINITRSKVMGCRFDRGPVSGFYGYGIYATNDVSPDYDNFIAWNEFENLAVGVYLGSNANAYTVFSNTIDNCRDAGVYLDAGSYVCRVISNRIEAITGNFINVNGSKHFIQGNYLEAYANPTTTGSLIYFAVGSVDNYSGWNYISAVSGTAVSDFGTGNTYFDENGNQITSAFIKTSGRRVTINTLIANTTLTSNNEVIHANANAGAFTITLPTAASCVGQKYTIKKVDANEANPVHILPQGGSIIDSGSSFDLWGQYHFITIISDGTNWQIIDRYQGNKQDYRTFNGTSTLNLQNQVVGTDATVAALDINLPDALGLFGVSFTVKKIDASANAVTVRPQAGDTIENAGSYSLTAQWKYITVTSDGNNMWLITASN